MPRTARIAPIGYVYHILTRGNNRQDIFKDEKDYKEYIKILQKYKEKYKFKLYHFVLMRNHVHLVLEPVEGDLADIMKRINQSYSKYYKNRYEHIGYFWQNRYKSIIVSKDNYLLACGSYVELNPVRAGVVDEPKDYRWSSYNVYGHGEKNLLIDESPVYNGVSNDEQIRREKYIEFIKEMIIKKNAMKDEMNKRKMYGNEKFIKRMAEEYQIEEMVRLQGRPKKK